MKLSRILPVVLPFLALGCGGKAYHQAYMQRTASPAALVSQARPSLEAARPPYQLALRLSPVVLDQTLSVMLSKNLLTQEKLATLKTKAGAQSGGAGVEQAMPRGPFGGRLMERVRQRFGEGGGGGMAEESFTPYVKATGARTRVDPTCDGCLQVELSLLAGLQPKGIEEEGAAAASSPAQGGLGLSGRVVLGARLASELKDGKPAFGVTITGMQGLQLDAARGAPPALQQLQGALEAAVKDRLTQKLSQDSGKFHQTVPLGEKLKLGPGVEVLGLGVHTGSAQGGEVFIGVNTNLVAEPGIQFDPAQGLSQGTDWAMVLGDGLVTQLLAGAVQQGKVPTRFNKRGRPEPEGPVALELGRLYFMPEGFQLASRISYFSFPAWWQDYTLLGSLELVEGRLVPRLNSMTPGAGGGAKFLGKLVEKKATSQEAVGKAGQALPTRMPMPMAEGYELVLTPTAVRTLKGAMQVSGSFAIEQKAAPQAP